MGGCQTVARLVRLGEGQHGTARSDFQGACGIGHLHHGSGIASGGLLDNAPCLALNGLQEAT